MKAFDTHKALLQYSQDNSYCITNTKDEIVEFVKENQGKYFYLKGADLRNADLSNLNLRGSNLSYADFNENTNFKNTILIDAWMWMSNLYNAPSFETDAIKYDLLDSKDGEDRIYTNFTYTNCYRRPVN